MIIDRFEGDYAVIEANEGDGSTTILVSKDSLPKGAREGDVVFMNEGVYEISKEKTEERRRTILEKIKRLRVTED